MKSMLFGMRGMNLRTFLMHFAKKCMLFATKSIKVGTRVMQFGRTLMHFRLESMHFALRAMTLHMGSGLKRSHSIAVKILWE